MKNIVITGGSKGIGKKIVAYLSKHYRIINLSREKSNFKGVENIYCDVSDHDSVRNAFTKIKKCHVLVNNAGISKYSDKSIENFNKIIDVNLKGVFFCCYEAIPKLKKSKNSKIINIASINAYAAFPNNPGYVASKSGVVGLTKSLALDYSKFGININSISPGYINTGMAKNSFLKLKERKKRTDRTILKRFGKPEDLFGTIDLLISNKSSYITGQDFIIDGGWLSKGF
jgi:NAD(P)-dependent dehydrogenase (short-subunit alcohol dehydrogenase family)